MPNARSQINSKFKIQSSKLIICQCAIASVKSCSSYHPLNPDGDNGRKQKQYTEIKLENSLFPHLFDTYKRVTKDYEKEQKPHLKTKKLIKLCALVYLLKNQCQIAPKPENPDRYQQYRRKKEIEIMRLEEQLKSRLPKGRNLDTGEWLEALEQVTSLMDLRLDTAPSTIQLHGWDSISTQVPND